MVSKIMGPTALYQQIASNAVSASKTPFAADTKMAGANNFANILDNFVQDVNTTKVNSEKLQQQYIKGEPVDMTDVLVSSSQANVQMNFLVATRDKAVDIYNTLFNMSI